MQECELRGCPVEGQGTEGVEGGHLVEMWTEEVGRKIVGRGRDRGNQQ